MVTTRVVSVWRPDPGSELGVAPDESLPRLSGEDAARVADYLDAGSVLARTTARMVDVWSGDGVARVGLTQRTDGVWRWDDAVSYFVRRYHLSPGPEFVAYLRERGFAPRVLSAAEVSAVTDEVFGSPGAAQPDRPLRLDGTQLLPDDYYCVYRGQAFRYNRAGYDDEVLIELALSPGQAIPEGFEPKDDRDCFVQAIAYKMVPASQVEMFYRVVTTCRYKGVAFSIRRIDGPRLRVFIGGGRRTKPSELPYPTMDEWSYFPNAEVLGMGEIWATIDIIEAAQVTMAIVPHQVVGEELVPVRDVTGAGYSVPAADEIFYFPSPADSPYLPPDQALATARDYLAAHDPAYPAADLGAQRLRDGWQITTGGAPADTLYYVADDGHVLPAPATTPAAQASSQLSAEFRQRHPFVDPPPHHDTGTDIFD